MSAYVYAFAEGSSEMRDVLGGKGAELAEMTSIGLPVPDGFTITTKACLAYLDAGGRGRTGSRAGPKHLAAWRSAAEASRRPVRSAARLGALGRARVDAGHDGHDPEPRA